MGKKKQINAEERWQRISAEGGDCWGVKIEKGMKLRDLPADIRIAAEEFDLGFQRLRFEAGKFWLLEYPRTVDDPWPTAVKVEVSVDDFLIELPDGDIDRVPAAAVTVHHIFEESEE